MRSRWVVFAISILLFCGCAHLPQPVRSSHLGESTEAGQCAGFFASLDHTVKGFGIRDPGEFRIPNFPYLRVNRFLASFRNELTTNDAFNTWIDHLLTLDRNARRHEIANLPPDMSEALRSDTGAVNLYDRVVACGDLLRTADFGALQQNRSLQKSAKAPDDYITLRRVFGIYPLTGIFVSIGVNNLHKTVHRSFSLQAPENWHGIRYIPEINNKSQPSPGEIMRHAERDAIGIPRFSAEARKVLFRFFAPVWEIQTESDDDRIGAPYWSIEGTLRIDTASPVVFEHLSYTRFKGDILTQLNYIIWFPSRPKKNSFDLFGGFLDGLIYRVTLDVDGQPLMYDTVHNCGCYHKFYPTARLEAVAKNGYTEPPLILEAPSLNPQTERMVIGLESGPHYVRFLYALNRGQEVDAISYVFADYDLLRSLPDAGGGYRSFFGESGIVSGSERTERYILWPMGVFSPGAMRQWGRHAVAFVGRRHFDDPDLINKNFKRNENLHRSSQ